MEESLGLYLLVFPLVDVEEVLALAIKGGLLPSLDLLVSDVGCPLELELQVALLDFLFGKLVPGLSVQQLIVFAFKGANVLAELPHDVV